MNANIKSKGLARPWSILVAVAYVAVATAWFNLPSTHAEMAGITVYKTPACGCCVDWIRHLRDNGFTVRVIDVPSTVPAREQFGVPHQLGSCHTGVFGNYWVEGHVPADLVQELMHEKPDDILGIAAPGMPMGSPGMEGPNPVEYQILAYDRNGKVSVYATRQGRTSSQ